jgi:putative SOS response-associated peptidase YedK
MCGYAQRIRAAKIPKLQAILSDFGIHDLPDGRFFPGTTVTGVIIQDSDGVRPIDATWWFMLAEKDGLMKPNRQLTTFNARNIDGPMFRKPLQTSRCIIPATAIVETKGKQSYLMQAVDGILLGGLFRIWAQGDDLIYSCTVITCAPHDRFKTYHDKSVPLMLPMDHEFLADWLDPTFTDAQYFRGVIDHMQLPTRFEVTPVKNSQSLEPLGQTEFLESD